MNGYILAGFWIVLMVSIGVCVNLAEAAEVGEYGMLRKNSTICQHSTITEQGKEELAEYTDLLTRYDKGESLTSDEYALGAALEPTCGKATLSFRVRVIEKEGSLILVEWVEATMRGIFAPWLTQEANVVTDIP